MKVLIDTDVLLDVALRRSDFFDNSTLVLESAETQNVQAAVAWHSLSNLAYIIQPDARPFIRDLLQFVELAPSGMSEAVRALSLPMKDLEDALQSAAAMSFGAAYVVTRNLDHYTKSPIPALSPAEFLNTIKTE